MKYPNSENVELFMTKGEKIHTKHNQNVVVGLSIKIQPQCNNNLESTESMFFSFIVKQSELFSGASDSKYEIHSS